MTDVRRQRKDEVGIRKAEGGKRLSYWLLISDFWFQPNRWPEKRPVKSNKKLSQLKIEN
jgi:hypothetical protein